MGFAGAVTATGFETDGVGGVGETIGFDAGLWGSATAEDAGVEVNSFRTRATVVSSNALNWFFAGMPAACIRSISALLDSPSSLANS
jgi:hypothetical protein